MTRTPYHYGHGLIQTPVTPYHKVQHYAMADAIKTPVTPYHKQLRDALANALVRMNQPW